jgi:hypothetical protein
VMDCGGAMRIGEEARSTRWTLDEGKGRAPHWVGSERDEGSGNNGR